MPTLSGSCSIGTSSVIDPARLRPPVVSSKTWHWIQPSPFHTSHASGGAVGSTPMPSAWAEMSTRSTTPARLSRKPRLKVSPGLRSGEAKQATPAWLNRSSSHTSSVRRPPSLTVIAASSRGGAIARSSVVLKTTGDSSMPAVVVATSVPRGTTTTESSAEESQNVRSARATEGGNGSMPTMLRKWV